MPVYSLVVVLIEKELKAIHSCLLAVVIPLKKLTETNTTETTAETGARCKYKY